MNIRPLLPLVAFAASQGAIAQELPEMSRQVAPPPSLAEMSPEMRPLREDYLANCTGEAPEAHPADTKLAVRFVPNTGIFGSFAMCMHPLNLARTRSIDSIDSLLLLLSAKDMAPLWEPIETRWGLGLAGARDAIAANPEKFMSSGYADMLNRDVHRQMVRANALAAIGRWEDAIAILDKTHADLTQGPKAKRKSYDFDRVHLSSSIGGHMLRAGDVARALDRMDADHAALDPRNPYETNLNITRAAYHAEAGRYQRALEIIQPAYAAYRAKAADGGAHYKVTGSDREFAWIFACALNGLGRTDEAKKYIDWVEQAEEAPFDPWLGQTRRTTQVRLQMNRCLNRPNEYYAVFLDDQFEALDNSWLLLQPSIRRPISPRVGWVVTDAARSAFEKRFRVLPEAYGPALRQWRDAPPAAVVSATAAPE